MQLHGTQSATNALLPLRLHLILDQSTETADEQKANLMERLARLNLFHCNRTGLDIFNVEHDPIKHKLSLKTSPVTSSMNVTRIVDEIIHEAGFVVPFVCHEEKQDQISGLVAQLKAFQTPDEMSRLQNSYKTELDIVIVGLATAYECDGDRLLNCEELDNNVFQVLKILLDRPKASNLFFMHMNVVLLNLLKLQIYGCLGAIDPAEKKALQYKQTQKELQSIVNELTVIEKYSACVGTVDPHNETLLKRRTELETLTSSMACDVSERGGQSFSHLSNSVRHFKESLGGVNTVLRMVAELEKVYAGAGAKSTLPEATVWTKSSQKFCGDLLQHFAFPDLIFPVVESVTSCILSVESGVDLIYQKNARTNYTNLDSVLLIVSDPVLHPSQDIISLASRCLEPRTTALFLNHEDLKILKFVLLTCKQSSLAAPELRISSNLIHEVIYRMIKCWRAELELKQRQEAEANELFKTRYVNQRNEEVLLENHLSCFVRKVKLKGKQFESIGGQNNRIRVL